MVPGKDQHGTAAMSGRAPISSGRALFAGKINFGQSTMNCIVLQITDGGAIVELDDPRGVPERLHLSFGDNSPRSCKQQWQSGKQLGLAFEPRNVAMDTFATEASTPVHRSEDSIRTDQMLELRTALDHVALGILLLDSQLKAQFVNRAFRHMWALPDSVADRGPAFTDLIRHGCRTIAYKVTDTQIERHVAEWVHRVSVSDPTPLDLRRSNGDVIRCQCTPLPDGGRMLSYTPVTDIVHTSDELRVLTNALENVEDGIVVLDRDLDAIFLNRRMRAFWEISEAEVERHPSYISLLSRRQQALPTGLTPEQAKAFPAARIAEIKAGHHKRDVQTPDGRNIRIHCTTMPNGRRMLTYCDVSDLVRHTRQLEVLATTDPLTGLFNREHFLYAVGTEWSRFQRYYRSMSVLAVDIDHFKTVNDRFGHTAGDEALKAVAQVCISSKRKSDVVGRLGGEEFAILLPETSLSRALIVAERIRKRIENLSLMINNVPVPLTASIGVAEAFVSMSGADALVTAAGDALYQAKSQGRNRSVCSLRPSPPKLAAE